MAATMTHGPEKATPRVLHVRKELPRLGAFLRVATRGDPQVEAALWEIGTSAPYQIAFLAWQAVRKGNRAGIVVGNVMCRGSVLPYTGFEGYFASTDLDPAAVVRAEAQMGRHILAELRRQLATSSSYEHTPQGSFTALRDVLHGQTYTIPALVMLNAHFGALLGKLRAQETMHAGWYDPFKDETYQSLNSSLTYIGRDKSLSEQYDLALWADRNTLALTPVTLDDDDLAGYDLMAEIGRLGHPLIRAALHCVA